MKNDQDFSYDLEINKAIEEIKKNKAKIVCIQLPDGLKPKAKEIADLLEEKQMQKSLYGQEAVMAHVTYLT